MAPSPGTAGGAAAAAAAAAAAVVGTWLAMITCQVVPLFVAKSYSD